MATWILPPQVSTWINHLSHPLHGRLAWRLLPLLCGMLFAQGRRTVAAWLRAGDLGHDYKPFYRFLGSVGRQHVWVTIAWIVQHPCWGVIGLPLHALPYIRQKDLPKIAPWNRQHFPFRTAPVPGTIPTAGLRMRIAVTPCAGPALARRFRPLRCCEPYRGNLAPCSIAWSNSSRDPRFSGENALRSPRRAAPSSSTTSACEKLYRSRWVSACRSGLPSRTYRRKPTGCTITRFGRPWDSHSCQ